MKLFDYNKAKALIENAPGVIEASIGIRGDYVHTGVIIYQNGNFTEDFISGKLSTTNIPGSLLGVPVVEIKRKNDYRYRYFPCYQEL